MLLELYPNNPREGENEHGGEWGGDETSLAMSW